MILESFLPRAIKLFRNTRFTYHQKKIKLKAQMKAIQPKEISTKNFDNSYKISNLLTLCSLLIQKQRFLKMYKENRTVKSLSSLKFQRKNQKSSPQIAYLMLQKKKLSPKLKVILLHPSRSKKDDYSKQQKKKSKVAQENNRQ